MKDHVGVLWRAISVVLAVALAGPTHGEQGTGAPRLYECNLGTTVVVDYVTGTTGSLRVSLDPSQCQEIRPIMIFSDGFET